MLQDKPAFSLSRPSHGCLHLLWPQHPSKRAEHTHITSHMHEHTHVDSKTPDKKVLASPWHSGISHGRVEEARPQLSEPPPPTSLSLAWLPEKDSRQLSMELVKPCRSWPCDPEWFP